MTSLRNKLWIGFGALVTVLLVVSVLTMAILTRYSHTLDRLFRENYDSKIYCDGMKDALDQLNDQAQRLMWENPGNNANDWSVAQANFERNLNLQQGNCTLDGEQTLTGNVAKYWQQFQVQYQKFIANPTDRAELYRSELLPRSRRIKQVAQQIADMNMNNMVSVDGQVKRTLVQVRNVLLVLVITGTLSAAVVLWTAGAAILRSLAALTGSARRIEAGDLDQKLTVRSRDELGQLADAFNSMAAKLREFRRLDHDRLDRTQQTTQLAIDSLPDAVLVIGPTGSIEIANRAADTYFGIKPGVNVEQLHLKWLTPLYNSIKLDHKAINPPGYQAAIQLFDAGEERFLLPRAVPMLGKNQEMIGVTVILVDVTHLRRTDEAKSSMVATVSHELRTPLTGMKMSLSMLSGDRFGPVSAQQRKLITAAREDGDRLNRIIDNLLNLSRIEAGHANFQFRKMPAQEILSQAVDPLRSAFTEKSLVLKVEAPDALPEVTADPAAIASALTNLLTNAIKFTPAGGCVWISAKSVPTGVQFTVRDSGPAIDPQYRARLFEKFFRIPRENGPTGAGLGLAIAREIVDAHGGSIAYDCTEGNAFTITLPIAGELATTPPG